MIWSRQVLHCLARMIVCLGILSCSWPSWGLPANMVQGNIYTAVGTGIASYSGDGGDAREAGINGAQGIAVDRNGNLYIADSRNHRIRKVTPGGTITSIAGGVSGYSGDGGPATAAKLHLPTDVAVDSVGNVYVAEQGRVRKISVDGKIFTVAGTGIQQSFTDGVPATLAAGPMPTAVAVDPADNLYVADNVNKRIYKIVDGILTTVAGDGTLTILQTQPQTLGEGGPATSAPIGTVYSMAFDSAGNLYFADYDYHRIRKVAGGIITTVAGNVLNQCDKNVGPANNLCFDRPYGIAIDKYDNLYVASGSSNGYRVIRKVANGVATLIVGYGSVGDGNPALLSRVFEPRGLAIDAAGNLYIAQHETDPRATSHSRVRVVATSASVTDIAGLSIACPATIAAGASASCNSTVTYGNGSSMPVTASWSSSDPAATMSGNILTANSVPGDTLVTISASYTEYGTTRIASQVVTVKSSSEPGLQDSIDCFFNWAEANLPALFNPPAGASETSNQYRYRRYDGSNMLLAVSTDTLRVFYAGELTAGAQSDIGPFQAWKAKACPNGSGAGTGSGTGSGGTTTVAITEVTMPNVTGTAKAGAAVILTAINTTTGEVRAVNATAGADGKWSATLPGLTDGRYELQPEANGVKGGKVTVVVDSQAPVSTLSVTSNIGPNAAGWYAGAVNLALSATDGVGGVGIARSEYTLDGGAPTVFPAGGLTLNADGSHTVCYRSIDKAGNAEVTRCVPIAIDATAPQVAPVFDAAGSTLNLNAQDAVSGIAAIEISRDGGQTWAAQSGAVGFARDGAYIVQYRVLDHAGNLASGQTPVTVNTVPVITAPAGQAAAEGAAQTFNLGSFSDQAADNPWNIDIDWGDGSAHSLFALAAPGMLGSLPHTYADSGSYTITVKVTDQAGNSGSKSFQATVSNAAPTAVLTASGPVAEGGTAAVAFASPSDPSSSDTLAGFHYAFACDGASLAGATYASSSTAATAACTFNDNGSKTVRARIIDKDEGFTEYTAVVAVDNVAPTATLTTSGPVGEGMAATLALTGPSDPSSADVLAGLHYAFACDGASLAGATYATSGTNATASCSFSDNGSKTVRARIIDKDEGFTEYSVVVMVNNSAPTAILTVTGPVNEGGTATVAFSNPGDASSTDVLAGFHYAFACDGASLAGATYATSGAVAATNCAYADGPASPLVRARILDKDGGFTEYTATVAVTNVAPTVSAVVAPTVAVVVNTGVTVSANFSDAGVLDTHTAVIDWGDGASSAGTVSEANGAGAVTGSHSYAAAGSYVVTVTVTDKDGATGSASYSSIVVVDPAGAAINGNGRLDSPAGAMPGNPGAAGNADVKVRANYTGGGALTGDTSFGFAAGNLNFQSTGYEWLAASGSKATLRGMGTVNGLGNYGMVVTVVDGGKKGPDLVRMKIWDKGTGQVVYDSQPGAAETADPTTPLTAGKITIK